MFKLLCRRNYCNSIDKVKCFTAEVRSLAESGFHSYFNKDGFIHIDMPVLTSAAISSEKKRLFYITVPKTEGKGIFPFEKMVYLHPSSQAHIGTSVSAFSKVYSIGPAFARKDDDSNSLNEYWLIETEEAFLSGSEGYTTLENRCIDCLKYVVQYIQDNMHSINNNVELSEHLKNHTREILEDLANVNKITYVEAIEYLSQFREELGHLYKYGDYIGKAALPSISRMTNNRPFIIQRYPNVLSEFHVANTTENSVECYKFSLFMPKYDKTVVGTIKENDAEILLKKFKQYGGNEEHMDWYFDSKQWGNPPSGGLIIGFDRFLQCLLQKPRIEDVQSFPRTNSICVA